MLIAKILADQLQQFIQNQNAQPQKDQNAAIQAFAQEQENLIYQAVKNLQITIPPGVIIVAGPSGAMTNATPIVLSLETCEFS